MNITVGSRRLSDKKSQNLGFRFQDGLCDRDHLFLQSYLPEKSSYSGRSPLLCHAAVEVFFKNGTVEVGDADYGVADVKTKIAINGANVGKGDYVAAAHAHKARTR